MLTESERLNLKNLINESDCENNTDDIRKLKHSTKIRDDIRRIENLKITHAELKATNFQAFDELCQTESAFLYNHYTDIFNKVLKNELDLVIMTRLLVILKMIEDNKLDQHEASVMVGKVLKELYVDSALKRADNLDKEHAEEVTPPVEGKPITWRQYSNSMRLGR
uniref:Uncharacterized protein n=1 Tax=viral metagenome TaxID=1070528 RepID=A0A6C0DRS0_9ZZZZ